MDEREVLEETKETNQKVKKERHKKEEKSAKKGSKKKIILIAIGCIILLLAIFSTVFALFNMGNSNIIKGISINGVDVSGLSMEEAKEKIESIVQEKKQKEITVVYEEYESTIDPTLIELSYDVNSVVEQAYSIGRSSNLIRNNYSIIKNRMFKKDLSIDYTINEEVARNTIEEMGANLPGAIIQSSYYIEDGNLIITKGTSGLAVDTEELLNMLMASYSNFSETIEKIEIPVLTKSPDAIDIDKIHEEVYKEVQDAYYENNPFTVYAEVEGVDFDVEEAKALLQEDKEEYVIKLTITKPKVTVNDLGEEAFPDLLSSFTTKYDVSNTDRTTNLKLAAQKINGTVLSPGEEFSYNKTLGERTIAAGYKEAKIYSNGQVVDGIGGGICQVSSTLYNVVVMANLDVTVRRNHQFVTSYVDPGRDATVVYGSQDFKFVNSRSYPVKLTASVSNGIVKISMYGIKEDKEYDISFQTNTISTIAYTTQYVEDSSLAEGQEVVKQKGTNGRVTETYKITKLNGVVVSKTLLSKDTYNAMQRIVRVGTASSSKTTTTTNETTTNTPEDTTTENSTSEEEKKVDTTATEPETTTESSTPEETNNVTEE